VTSRLGNRLTLAKALKPKNWGSSGAADGFGENHSCALPADWLNPHRWIRRLSDGRFIALGCACANGISQNPDYRSVLASPS